MQKKYGLTFKAPYDDLRIEMFMIQKGGRFEKNGESHGEGLAYHYEEMRKILWPHVDAHRWHQLCLKEIRRDKAKVTVLIGPGSSGKTFSAAWNYLCEYFCFPNETCVLISSTDLRGLELRVWGEIKSLFDEAKAKFPYLPGNLIDSKHAISTESIEDENSVRDMRKGIIGIPTIQGGKFIGLGKWVGVKQKRMRLIADEAQFMAVSFLSAFANLDKNEDFQAIVLGNPVDILDPLGRAAEPIDGWTNHMEPTKTDVWPTRFMGGRAINLVGLDSPNMDGPADQPARYKYLISREKIANTAAFFGKDSVEYYSQCVGVMKIGQLSRRVITRDLCEKFGAREDVIWDAAFEIVNIGGLDAAYNGDRCALNHIQMGKDLKGKQVIRINEPVIVPISVNSPLIPEDQIAEFCKNYCEERDIPPENFFHDSTGRGTLGTSLARVWSNKCNPVEFGGKPTARPVSLDLFIDDPETGERRLKRCDEEYSKFVTELWFAVRLAIESGQLKNLPEETMEEGCLREWSKVKGDKKEIESKKDMKERIGRSPDLFDCAAIGVEGARRKGFMISKIGKTDNRKKKEDTLLREAQELEEMQRSKELELA